MNDVALVIRIDLVGLPTEKAAQGKSDWTARQIKQVGCVNVQVQCRELRSKKVAPMQRSEVDQWYIGCDGNLEIVKGIVRYRLSNKISRGRIKERIVCVENALKSRAINVSGLTDIQDFAVAKPRVVAPASIKELISFYADGAQPGFVFVIKQSVTEIGNSRTGLARDELSKRVEWVKGARRCANFRSSRSIRRLGSSRDGSMWWDKDRK